jgi:hypothetical protein
MPITAPPGVWTWVPFPDSTCNDGSPLGIGINPSSTSSSNVVVYLNGGGACWDGFTCLVAMSATLGPYTEAQMQHDAPGTGGVLSREPRNPYRDWNYVFIPYCTGDVHAGNNVVTYSFGTTTSVFHHKGHANFLTFMERVGATFPSPDKVLIAGDSAGGAGAVVNYTTARRYWPSARMYLIDDSLLFFAANETPAQTMSSELANWGIQPLLREICGDDTCQADFSRIYTGLRRQFPSDRMAVISYEQDGTMSLYYETLQQLYQTYLNQLTDQVLHPANYQTYFLNGTNHTMLFTPATDTTSTGVNLWDWLNQMESDDPQWTSAGP